MPRRCQFESLEPRDLLTADLELVRDLNLSYVTGSTSAIAEIRGSALIVQQELVHHTPGDRLAERVPLCCYSGIEAVSEDLVVLDGPPGTEYFSDGKPDGTFRVPGKLRLRGDFGMMPQKVGEVTYFISKTNEFGVELWRTDGTEAGTRLLKDISPGVGSAGSTRFDAFLNFP